MIKTLAIIACAVSLAVAQKLEIGGDIGYGFGAGEAHAGANTTSDGLANYTKYEDIYSSDGNGLKARLDMTMFLNDNIGLMGLSRVRFSADTLKPTSTHRRNGQVYVQFELFRDQCRGKIQNQIKRHAPRLRSLYLYNARHLFPLCCHRQGNFQCQLDNQLHLHLFLCSGFGFAGGVGAQLNDGWHRVKGGDLA